MRFRDIATAMISKGIRVIPLQTGSKAPMGIGAPGASTDPWQITEWDKMNPTANCGSVATPDGCWFLDIDDAALIDQILVEAKQKAMPETFTVATSRGRHYYFSQTDASREMGNVVIPGRAEARVFNYYVVSPGSLHPSGTRYAVCHNNAIAPAPVWLIEYLSSYKAKTTNSSPRIADADAVQSSLDWLHGWVTGNNVPVLRPEAYQGGYKIYAECPNKAEHTTDSGPTQSAITISSDGKFGFRCHHSHCATIDWTRFRAAHEPSDAELRGKMLAAYGITGPVKLTKAELKKRGEWAFPRRSLYGPLGKLALEIEVPLGFGYPALITAFAGRGVPERSTVRTTMYCALIADVYSGKTQTIDRATAAIGVAREERTPSSDRGLEKILQDTNGANVLITADELKTVFAKASIENSSLAATLCSLWSRDRAGSVDKTGGNGIHARLSLLGGLPVSKRADFKKIFSAETRAGLYSRFVFGCLDKGEKWEYTPPKEILESIRAVAVDVAPHWHEKVASWVKDMEKTYNSRYGRMGEILLRVAVILASANGETELSEEAFNAAKAFSEWQIRIRSYYVPSSASNEGGEVHEAILELLRSVRPHAVSKKNLLADVRESLGLSGAEVLREFKAMVESESFHYDKELGRCWIPLKEDEA
jgi:hypothetical protein